MSVDPKTAFCNALSFLTVIRFRNGGEFYPKAALYWFAPVGLLIGAGLALIHTMSGAVSPFLMIAYLAIITGFLHLDGLADTFDGLFSNKSRREKLRIMRDSRIGAIGAAALILSFLGKYHAFKQLAGFWPFVAIPSLSRFSMVFLFTVLPYLRKTGLGKEFSCERGGRLFIQIAPAEIIILFALGIQSWFLINSVFAAVLLFIFLWYKRSVGGITGDTLGAACEITETALFLTCVWL
ncbi:MAG: adenosylcobinamide-GDP ribazoletransferase [Deferribacteraceae bacterium]|nr:adenosylcobinamide-GDP ribazoletransferase [Deferribacteraceae bacterium]